MHLMLTCLAMSIACHVTHGSQSDSVLKDVIKGQLDVIKHCVGLGRYAALGNLKYLDKPYQRRRSQVAFQAHPSKTSGYIPNNHKIVFDTVDLNESGGYSGTSGIFTAPMDGLYVFHWTTMLANGKDVATVLTVDGLDIGKNFVNGKLSPSNIFSSQTVVVRMRKNQKAWLKASQDKAYIFGGNGSIFTGYLL